jgi:hypothetical protein
MLVGKMIDRRQEKLEDELQELKELLAARGKNEGAGG